MKNLSNRDLYVAFWWGSNKWKVGVAILLMVTISSLAIIGGCQQWAVEHPVAALIVLDGVDLAADLGVAELLEEWEPTQDEAELILTGLNSLYILASSGEVVLTDDIRALFPASYERHLDRAFRNLEVLISCIEFDGYQTDAVKAFLSGAAIGVSRYIDDACTAIEVVEGE